MPGEKVSVSKQKRLHSSDCIGSMLQCSTVYFGELQLEFIMLLVVANMQSGTYWYVMKSKNDHK